MYEVKNEMKQKKIKLIIMVTLLLVSVGAYLGMHQYNKKQDEKTDENESQVLASISMNDILSFSYILDDQTLSFTKKDDAWIYDEDPSLPIMTSNIEKMLSDLSNITYTTKLEDIDNLSDFGFDKPTNVITCTTADKTYTFTVGMYNQTLNGYYIKTDENDTTIYLVSGSLGEGFCTPLDSLIEKGDSVSGDSVSGDSASVNGISE